MPVSHVSCSTRQESLHGLAFLADDPLIRIAHALALVRFRRVEAAQLRRHLADRLPIRSLNSKLGVLFNRHFDLGGYRIHDGMRIAQTHVYVIARHSGLETDALNLKFLDETFTDTADHIIDQGAAEAMQRFGPRVIAVAADYDLAVLYLEAGTMRQFPVELAFRPFNENLLAFDLDFHLGR